MRRNLFVTLISIGLLNLLACTTSLHKAEEDPLVKRQKIYDRYDITPNSINQKSLMGLSPFTEAVRKQDIEALREFVTNPRLNIYTEDRSLVIAIRLQNVEMVKLLLDAGIRVNTRNRTGDTPLIIAARTGSSSIVHMLIRNGADVNATNLKERSAIMEAAGLGYMSVVELLIQSDANLNLQSNTSRTALMYAAAKGFTNISVKLIEAGAKVDTVDIKDRNPIYIASAKGDLKLLKRLLQSGAKVNINKTEKKALSIAAKKGYTEIVQNLIQAHREISKSLK